MGLRTPGAAPGSPAPDQQDVATRNQAGARAAGARGVNQPQRADHRGGIDVAAPALVVEADIAAHDRDGQPPAGFAHPVDRLRKLPHDLGVLGVAEVEAVDEGHRPGPHAGHVEGRLRHDQGGAGPGVEGAPAGVSVRRQGQAPRRSPGPPGRPARPAAAGRRRRRAPPRCSRTADGRTGGKPRTGPPAGAAGPRRSRAGRAAGPGRRGRRPGGRPGRRAPPWAGRRSGRPRGGWRPGRPPAPRRPNRPGSATGRCRSPDRRPSPAPPTGGTPPAPDRGTRGDDGQHPFLALAGHDLPRLHARLATRNGGHVDVHPDPDRGTPSRWSRRSVRPRPGPGFPRTSRSSSSWRQASIKRFSSNGSPTWTLGRLAVSASASRRIRPRPERSHRRYRHAR